MTHQLQQYGVVFNCNVIINLWWFYLIQCATGKYRVSDLQHFYLTLILLSVASASCAKQQSHENFRSLLLLCILCEMNGWHYSHVTDRRVKHKQHLQKKGTKYIFIFQTNKNTLGTMETLLSMTAYTYFSCKSSLQYSGSFMPSISSITSDKVEVL